MKQQQNTQLSNDRNLGQINLNHLNQDNNYITSPVQQLRNKTLNYQQSSSNNQINSYRSDSKDDMMANIAMMAMNDGEISDLNFQILNDSHSNFQSIVFNNDESIFD